MRTCLLRGFVVGVAGLLLLATVRGSAAARLGAMLGALSRHTGLRKPAPAPFLPHHVRALQVAPYRQARPLVARSQGRQAC